jgi:hypothetical protein
MDGKELTRNLRAIEQVVPQLTQHAAKANSAKE